MTAVVVDASAAIEYLLGTARAERFERVIRDEGNELFVPSLCDVEVASTLRRGVLSGRLSPDRSRQALGDYRDLPFTRFGTSPCWTGSSICVTTSPRTTRPMWRWPSGSTRCS